MSLVSYLVSGIRETGKEKNDAAHLDNGLLASRDASRSRFHVAWAGAGDWTLRRVSKTVVPSATTTPFIFLLNKNHALYFEMELGGKYK